MTAPFNPPVVGIELGGTKCICTLAAGPGAVVAQQSIPTEDPGSTLGAIVDCLNHWRGDHGFAAIGIGSFGPIDLDPRLPRHGMIRGTAKPGWDGVDLLKAIAGQFDLPCRVDTDVNAAALAERRWGCGHGVKTLAYVTVGTGIGVGFARDGAGPSYSHAELGHIRVAREPYDDRISVCAHHRDCAEGLASGRAIRASMEAPGDLPFTDPRWARSIAYLGQLCHAILCGGGIGRIAFGGGVMTGNPGLVPVIERAARHSLGGYLALPDEPLLAEAALGVQAGPLGTIALALDALADLPE